MQENYLSIIEELNQDFFKNYWEMEKIVVAKLAEEGQQYFIDNKCYDMLGKFEPTIKAFCEIMEKINEYPGCLLTYYLHLNDIENVKKQFELLKQYPGPSYIFKDFHDYQDAGKVLGNQLISIRYDQRIAEFAEKLHKYADEAEIFMNKEWENLLPPKIRVILLNSEGSGPYNPDLNETYFPVKSRKVFFLAGGIVHETFHLINHYLIEKASNFKCSMDENSFKFIDEGYAQLIQYKFQNESMENRKKADDYSKKIMLENSFKLTDLKSKWMELFSSKDIVIGDLALSFACFLEDKYGAEKHKALFLPKSKIKEKSWLEYAQNYFGTELDILIDEWKPKLLKM